MSPISIHASCPCFQWVEDTACRLKDLCVRLCADAFSFYHLVSENDLKRKDVKNLNIVIRALLLDKPLPFEAHVAFEELCPGFALADYRNGEGELSDEEVLFRDRGMQGIDTQIASVKKQLLTALKTELCSHLFSNKVQKEELTTLKSEFLRLWDVKASKTSPGQRPKTKTTLQLKAPSDTWAKPGKISTKIPPYLYYFAHPINSQKANNELVYRQQERWCNGHSPWYKALRSVEPHLKKPLSSQELFQLIANAFLQFDGSRQDFKRNEDVPLLHKKESFSQLATRFRQQGMEKASEHLQLLSYKEHRWSDLEKAVQFLTTEEWNELQKVAFIPPYPVDNELQIFITELDEHFKNQALHPFQVAAYIHFSLTSIRPYHHANGCMARLFMNIYLMQKGFHPLVVVNEQEYLDLFQAADYETAFCTYLDNFQKNISTYNLPKELQVAEWLPSPQKAQPEEKEDKQDPYVVVE